MECHTGRAIIQLLDAICDWIATVAKYVSKLPSGFVNYLTSLGLSISSAGSIPLRQYVCSVEAYGGSKNAESVIGALNAKIPVDSNRTPGRDGNIPPDNRISAKTRKIGRMMTGQGYPDDFVLVMGHFAANFEEAKKLVVQPYESVKGEDGKRHSVPDGRPRAISSIFGYKGSNAEDYLNAMVEKKVFGLDCIGFVSQYLVYSGVWSEYKTYYPDNYAAEFKPISKLSQIVPLAVMIWDNYHIAIIDSANSFSPNEENPTSVTVDVCQSSSGGPQINKNVEIAISPGDKHKSYQRFKFKKSSDMPVKAPVYIGVMPGLVHVWDVAGVTGTLIDI
jgi:hypothetical protein